MHRENIRTHKSGSHDAPNRKPTQTRGGRVKRRREKLPSPLAIPLLRHHTLRGHSLHRAIPHIAPVGAECRAVALDEALHHGALLLRRRALIELLEEEVDVALIVVALPDFGIAQLVPVLGAAAAACWVRGAGRSRCRGSCCRFSGRRRLGGRCGFGLRAGRGRRRRVIVVAADRADLFLAPCSPLRAGGGLLEDQLDFARCRRPTRL